MSDYFSELKNGPSGPSYKVKDEKAHSSIEALINDVSDVETALAEKADTDDIPDLVSDNLAKGILGNETVLSTDNVPFVSKVMGAGKYQRKKFVGVSFVWNQLVDSNTESVTIASGHKYALYQNGAWSIGASDGTAIAVTGGSDLFTDLTQLFGSTAIADYIYNLEQATAGAGIAKLKELGFFTEDYYAYDAGSVQSVDIKEYAVTGKNLCDGADSNWKNSTYIDQYGEEHSSFYHKCTKGFILVFGNITYALSLISTQQGVTESPYLICYDSSYNYLSGETVTLGESSDGILSGSFTVAENVAFVRISLRKVYTNIQLEIGSTATEYEPYHKTTYPLTPTELRGVPRIDANNNIYCDGDEYASDGGHTEKYDIVDMGTLNWSYMDGVFSTNLSDSKIYQSGNLLNMLCSICPTGIYSIRGSYSTITAFMVDTLNRLEIRYSGYTSVEDFVAFLTSNNAHLVYEKATPTAETLTPFDYPQSVGSLEEITDYKVEQGQRDVAIPTGHVTEYMGKGGEFTLPTLPETPSVLAFDGHNFFWNKNVIDEIETAWNGINHIMLPGRDLTVIFADEISNYSDEWAWIQARLDAHDVSGLRVGDYIPIKIAANGNIAAETHNAEIAGINTYYNAGDGGHEVGYHIDWITRDCYSGTVKFNASNNNNGNESNSSPFLASNLKSWLDGTLYPLLETKLKNVIKAKRILAPYRYQSDATLTDDNSWDWQDFDKLWVPLEGEIFDSLVWSTKGYGNGQAVQYPIFANSYAHRIKGAGPGGARANWWTASAYSGDSTSVVLVYRYGYSINYYPSSAHRVPVCFRTMEA